MWMRIYVGSEGIDVWMMEGLCDGWTDVNICLKNVRICEQIIPWRVFQKYTTSTFSNLESEESSASTSLRSFSLHSFTFSWGRLIITRNLSQLSFSVCLLLQTMDELLSQITFIWSTYGCTWTWSHDKCCNIKRTKKCFNKEYKRANIHTWTKTSRTGSRRKLGKGQSVISVCLQLDKQDYQGVVFFNNNKQ